MEEFEVYGSFQGCRDDEYSIYRIVQDLNDNLLEHALLSPWHGYLSAMMTNPTELPSSTDSIDTASS